MIAPIQKGFPALLYFYVTKTEYSMLTAENLKLLLWGYRVLCIMITLQVNLFAKP